MNPFVLQLLITILGIALVLPVQRGYAQDQPHRDEFRMNFIGGGDFRSYVSDAVTEDDLWAHSMRTLGTFHNLMHEMMSDLARHDAEETGSADRVPNFGARISGGGWTEYRETLEEAAVESVWRDLVQVTEIMHNRVHHAMYHAAIYDWRTRARAIDLNDYLRQDTVHPFDATIPAAHELRMEHVSSDQFRSLVWHGDIKAARLHASLQKMLVFNHMLYDLLDQWARYGAGKEQEACRPPPYRVRITGEGWREYADLVQRCEDREWRELVQVAGLMQQRIHHMMYRMTRHVAAMHEHRPSGR
jgi:hypothetical protein